MTNDKKLYWSPAITVDTVIFTIEEDDLKVLLVKRTNHPFHGYLALPGGFLLKNELTSKAVSRILRIKAGIKSNIYLEQLYTFDNPKRDPRGHVLSVSYMALVPYEKITFDLSARESPTFYSVKNLKRIAFDHKQVIDYAVRRLRAKLEYTNVVFSLLPKQFTLNQLQKTYEVILGRKLDKRNFRKKFALLDLIKPTKSFLRGSRQRPARLYQFVSRRPTELKKFF